MEQSGNSSPSRQRYLALEGSYNIRDIGGYPTLDGHETRWGAIVRADSLSNLPVASQRALLDYPIHTVIDLRRSSELQASPDVFAESPHVRYVNISLLEDESKIAQVQSLEELYRLILETYKDQIKLVIETIAQKDTFPCLLHCTIGKDRTGLIVAILLSLSNIDPTIIADDYALSEQYLDPLFQIFRARDEQRGIERSSVDRERLAWIVRSRRETMLATLSYLEEQYGGVSNYLASLGISSEQMASIRAQLVED